MIARHTSDSIYQIVGAAYEVQHEIGYGLLEAVYNEAMRMELQKRNVNVQSEVEVPIYYKGEKMKKHYRVDLLCDNIIIELKVVDELTSEHRFQLFNYMRLTNIPYGLLINFGKKMVESERYQLDMETRKVTYF
ncbi:MAG: GxxExxY protein [Paludibacteraceae bacterium]